jgi:hypothetical protein
MKQLASQKMLKYSVSDALSTQMEKDIDDLVERAAFNESQKTFQQMSQRRHRGIIPLITRVIKRGRVIPNLACLKSIRYLWTWVIKIKFSLLEVLKTNALHFTTGSFDSQFMNMSKTGVSGTVYEMEDMGATKELTQAMMDTIANDVAESSWDLDCQN